jgi:hypothetical protein
MFQFSIKDLIWLTLVVAMGIRWFWTWTDLEKEQARFQHLDQLYQVQTKALSEKDNLALRYETERIAFGKAHFQRQLELNERFKERVRVAEDDLRRLYYRLYQRQSREKTPVRRQDENEVEEEGQPPKLGSS